MTKDGEMEKDIGSYVAPAQASEPRAKLETRAERFTPGPWTIEAERLCFDDGDGTVPSWIKGADGFPVVDPTEGLCPDAEWTRDLLWANAHLLAATPEMYEALKAALAALERNRMCEDEAGMLRAALAKARGES